MFTGFASENTPAIQVWDFFRPFASTAAIRNISLADDCAPIQFFQTGGSSTTINIYLPTCPIEGKQIRIINTRYGANAQQINILSSDRTETGATTAIYTIGPSGSILLTYSKSLFSIPSTFGTRTGWLALDQASTNTDSANSALIAGNSNIAAGLACTVIGGQSNTNNSFYGSIIGGSTNFISNNNSSIVGGQNNTANQTNAAVVGGSSNTASNTNTAVVGGASNTASSVRAAILGGDSNTANNSNAAVVGGTINAASGQNSVVIGGTTSTANASNSAVFGGYGGSVRSVIGYTVFPASNAPVSFSQGTSQAALLVLGKQITDATPTRLTSNGDVGAVNNQVILPNNSAYYVKGSIIATVTGGGNTKSWDFIATIKRGANAAATSIVGAVTLNVQAADAGAATWVVAITADTTNGGLAVTVTGQAATTIRWVAKLESTEVTY